MPEENGYGWSDHTQQKTQHFKQLIEMFCKINRLIYEKPESGWLDQTFRAFDCTAGPGRWDGVDQMALIEARAVRELMPRHSIHFWEKEPETFEVLRHWIGTADKRTVFHDTSFDRDLRETIRQTMPGGAKYQGYLCYDPVPGKENEDELRYLADVARMPQMQRIDFLFYFSATVIKRMVRTDNCEKRLLELLQMFPKKTFAIREPLGKYQWTIIVATNWAKMKDYKSIGLYMLDSERGKAIARKLNNTAKENDIADYQGGLFSCQ